MQRERGKSMRINRFFSVHPFGALLLILVLVGLAQPGWGEKLPYPPARMDASVVDDYHGTQVADPYRWLENPDSPETMDWVEAENKLTADFVNIPAREKIKTRLTKLWNYPKYGLPKKRGEWYFFTKNEGLQNQSVLYMQKGLETPPAVVIDPNQLSTDGTIALTATEYTKDGTLLAYALSAKGSDEQEFKIRNLDTGKDYDEALKQCKFTDIAWKHNKEGFFYNRYPDPSSVAPEDRNRYNKVYWHKLETPQLKDPLIYERPDNKDMGFSPSITDDGKYLVLNVWHGTDPKNRIYYKDLETNGPVVRLLDEADAMYGFVHNVGSTFYFHTDLNASRGRIIAIDLKNPAKENWKEILPQQDDVISSVYTVNNQFVAVYKHHAHNQLKIYNTDGSFVRDIKLPTIGSVSSVSGRPDDTEMFYSFSSFLYPSTIFRYDLKTNQTSIFRKPDVDFDPAGYETKQVFYPSKDGTKIPMFLTHKKGLKLDGTNPVWLYGYGGFNSSMTPFFSTTRLVWLEAGGVFAVACMRGGDEYGEEWHQAGMLEKKQNVFDDFIAAGEWLIANKYTSSSKLVINGGSNGGLLVAACMLQRPELFGAVVCQVPVIDMLRYHKFTVGHYWAPEYGNAEENPAHFKFLRAYSPLHNIKKGTAYPPAIITSADTDDRVVPAHSKKFAAAIQVADAGKNPILLRVETKAGHGVGKPTTKVIEEQSDIYAFVFKVLGMENTLQALKKPKTTEP
ncbi:MAG: prolyl oligopeptidase family serine peptidase [Limisphaerales bacterium]